MASQDGNFSGSARRVYGPPGTGKTTFLSKKTAQLVGEHGQDSILLASFSVTAAHEIVNKLGQVSEHLRPNRRAIGTLHSHAFRSLGHGNVALEPKILAGWNESVKAEWRITPDSRNSNGNRGDGGANVSDPQQAVTGDELLSCLDKLRAARAPQEDWPENIRRFHASWNGWKSEAGALDFTDMIEIALERALDGETAPGKPKYIIADEAQDMTPLEVALTLAWGEQADQLIIGMDDDQAINRWRGGDPRPLLGLDGDDVSDHVLSQSWRVPSSVHALAERWVKRLSFRKDKEYRPRRDANDELVVGEARTVRETLADPGLVGRIMDELDAHPVREGEAPYTVMVIASCNYMLEALIKNLRSEGVPFHNPFRPSEGRWNPLGAAGNGMSTAERVYRYMVMDEDALGERSRLWTGEDVQAWMELVKAADAGMVRGCKKLASLMDPKAEAPFESIEAMFKDADALERATTPDIEWLAGNLLAGRTQAAQYPLQVVRQHGPGALADKPRVVVGTIHSVKGAAADVVYLAPDISGAARQGAQTVAGRDELIRLFYVGMTRAYRELRLLTPSGNSFIKPRDLIPTDMEVIA